MRFQKCTVRSLPAEGAENSQIQAEAQKDSPFIMSYFEVRIKLKGKSTKLPLQSSVGIKNAAMKNNERNK